MTLRVVAGDRGSGAGPEAPAPSPAGSESRVLAPNFPPSPGTLPLEVAELVPHGEAVLWWGRKHRVDLRPAAMVSALVGVILLFVTALVPEFWAQPLDQIWQPLLALCSPVLLLLVRERANLRTIVVTDAGILDVPARGRPDRLGYPNVVRVRRDVLWGGVRMAGMHHHVRIPPSLAEDARAAIRVARSHTLRGGPARDDPARWLD